jgi:hypothetical protein
MSTAVSERAERAAARIAASVTIHARTLAIRERSHSFMALADVIRLGLPLIRGGGADKADEASIRERIRILVEGRVLPRVRPPRVCAGRCSETHKCVACVTSRSARLSSTSFCRSG